MSPDCLVRAAASARSWQRLLDSTLEEEQPLGSLSQLTPRPDGASSSASTGRFHWPYGSCYEAHGVRWGVRANDPRVLASLPTILPPGAQLTSSQSVDLAFSLQVMTKDGFISRKWAALGRVDGECCQVVRHPDLARALTALESAMRQGVATLAPHRVFVHAGVVGWRGRAILLPGPSRSGKSRLVAALVRAGASYLSDEFAALDAEGRVHAFAKPLSIRVEGGCDCEVRRVHVEELGGRTEAGPLPVGLIAIVAYRSGTSWRPEMLSRGGGVLEALAHTVPARLRPEAALTALVHAASAAAVLLKGERGEAGETAHELLATLDGKLAHPPGGHQCRQRS